jgi:predicted transcriptional regulator
MGPQLGELERVVMERIWAASAPVPVRDVLEDVSQDRTVAYTTIMTIMDRLTRKGFLRRTKRGRAYLYEPVSSREQYTAQLMSAALATTSDRQAVLLHFADSIDADEADALRRALARARRRSRGGSP